MYWYQPETQCLCGFQMPYILFWPTFDPFFSLLQCFLLFPNILSVKSDFFSILFFIISYRGCFKIPNLIKFHPFLIPFWNGHTRIKAWNTWENFRQIHVSLLFHLLKICSIDRKRRLPDPLIVILASYRPSFLCRIPLPISFPLRFFP